MANRPQRRPQSQVTFPPSSSAATTIRCRSSLSSPNSLCARRDNSNSRSASLTIPASRAVRARLLLQSMADSPFTLEPRYLLYPWALAHSLAELEEREDAAWELLALLAPVRQRHHNWFLQGYIDSEGVEHPYNHRFVEFRIAWCLFWRGESYRKFQERLVSQRRHRR